MLTNKYQIILALAIFSVCLYGSNTQTPSVNVAKDQNVQKLSTGSEQFALDIFRRIAKGVENDDYDFMISPFSIWSLLVLCAEGAGGNTLRELQNSLRLTQEFSAIRDGFSKIQQVLNVNTSTITVSAFQAVFPDLNQPLNPGYQNALEKFYDTRVVPVDYRQTRYAQQSINSYVEKATNGIIDYLVNEGDLSNARLALVSTIYFKGQWKFPFNKTFTKQEPFYDEQSRKVATVNMMYAKGPFPYTTIAQLDSHVLELPYGKEDRLVMIIFLPRKGVPLTTIIEKMAAMGVTNISNELKRAATEFEDDEVEVYLPRFSTTSDFQMNVILEQMGILDAFDSSKAQFPMMSNYPMYISNVFHKTQIEVTEEGTVASGATAGIFANKATPPRFYVNRPFAYIILEKSSNSLLFCGQVRKPNLF